MSIRANIVEHITRGQLLQKLCRVQYVECVSCSAVTYLADQEPGAKIHRIYTHQTEYHGWTRLLGSAVAELERAGLWGQGWKQRV